MPKQKKPSVAEQIERFMNIMAFAVLWVSIIFALKTLQFFVGEEAAQALNTITMIGGALIILVFLPLVIRYKIMRGKNLVTCRETEGFVLETVKQAGFKAFEFTFLFLVLLQIVNKNLLPPLPGDFFIKLIISVMLAIFGLTFFVLNRSGNDSGEKLEEGESA